MIKTTHTLFFKNSVDMKEIKSNSIDLIITSPPYPMIEMWDDLFSSLNSKIQGALEEKNGKLAYNLMHEKLNETWKECIRTLRKGGIICVNIGDSTRKIENTFQLFPNHIKTSQFFQDHNCISLPIILWRKPTNSPTKFMGSGMLPSNAYVTLEHEYILIFRKGKKTRRFEPKSEKRYHSAFFWEERNKWFSDIWKDMRGVSQNLQNYKNLRERSGAYPLELPYRLINMFSIYGDNILDPFWGTGTTSLAAMILARNSFGYELNSEFMNIFENNAKNIEKITSEINRERMRKHIDFIQKYSREKEIKYSSKYYGFPVITSQERNMLFYSIKNVSINNKKFNLIHEKYLMDQRD